MANSQEPAGDGNSTEKAKLAWVNNAIVAGVVSAVIAGAISLTAVSIQDHDNAVQAQATQEIQATGQWETAAQALFETANSIYDYPDQMP